jgi:pimeloyl-ACP methyl ester carboxylesterase
VEKLNINGEVFEIETKGTGEPLVLIHGSISAETFHCLLADDALTSRFQVTHYYRRGFLGSPKHAGPFSIAQQAADALGIINAVAGGRAHVAGHSYGGATALQVALDAPGAVHSLTLMEPLPPEPVPSFETFFAQVGPVNEKYAAGDKSGATQAFLDVALEPAWEPKVAGHLPAGWFERAVADIDGFFQVELPAVEGWMASQPAASSIKQPTLSVLGGDSSRYFGEVHELLLRLIPGCEGLVVPNATHGLQFMNPRFVAEGIAAFCAKHPMKVAATA